jgi:hypothetical protein
MAAPAKAMVHFDIFQKNIEKIIFSMVFVIVPLQTQLTTLIKATLQTTIYTPCLNGYDNQRPFNSLCQSV